MSILYCLTPGPVYLATLPPRRQASGVELFNLSFTKSMIGLCSRFPPLLFCPELGPDLKQSIDLLLILIIGSAFARYRPDGGCSFSLFFFSPTDFLLPLQFIFFFFSCFCGNWVVYIAFGNVEKSKV